MPNLKEYESVIRDALEGMDEGKRREGEMVVQALMQALAELEGESVGAVNGVVNGHASEMKGGLEEKIGGLFADRVLEMGRPKVLKVVLEC